MIPFKTIEDLISKHSLLEKDLSSGKIDKKIFAEKSKEYADLNEIIHNAKKYISYEKDRSELQKILDDKNHPDAKKGVLGNRTVGSLYDLITAKNLQESRGKRNVLPNTWHRARIVVSDSHVEHWLDNIKMLEYDRHSQVFNSLVNYSKYQKWQGFGQADSANSRSD